MAQYLFCIEGDYYPKLVEFIRSSLPSLRHIRNPYTVENGVSLLVDLDVNDLNKLNEWHAGLTKEDSVPKESHINN